MRLGFFVALMGAFLQFQLRAEAGVPDPLAAAADSQAAAAAPGATRVGPFYQGFANKEDDRSDWYLPLTPGTCYWFSGAGGPGVQKLYLYLWDQNGKRVADIKPSGPMALLAYCPTVGGMYHLQAKSASGHGPYTVGVYQRAGMPARAPALAPPPQLGALCDATAAAQAPGAARVGGFYSGSAGRMGHSDWFAELRPGHCYWIVGQGGEGVTELSLFLWGPDGRRITEAKPKSPSPVIAHCPVVPGMYKFQAKVAAGGGPYVVGLYARRQQ
ncbi:MAG: hypothetical protein RMK29_18710 [Myxococcales bacterium]|nr:hypothetical protein [Myxococcota bacterium]MDW8283740.1 hypothetical protein [Myxococcales bacterium]